MSVASWDVTIKGGPATRWTPDSPFPWGKHKGTPINRVPKEYLGWALAKADNLLNDLELRAVVEQVLGMNPTSVFPGIATPPDASSPRPEQNYLRRAYDDATRRIKDLEAEVKRLRIQANTATTMKLTDVDRFRSIVKQMFRAMSLSNHPDRGGNKEKQTVVNACYQDLLKRLEGDQ